jgi:HK97 family phage prohead protease
MSAVLSRLDATVAGGANATADDGLFTGYASLFNVTDLSGDMLLPGAFRASIARRGAGGIKMLYQHDPATPLGQWLQVEEDGRGLRVTGRLHLGVERAREVASLVGAGILDGLSIGFRTVRARTDAKTGVRRLAEVDLWEISIVTFPMLPGARIAAVAGDGTKSASVAARMQALGRRLATPTGGRRPRPYGLVGRT